PGSSQAARRLVDHLDGAEARAPGRGGWQGNVELEVARVDVRERLREREALGGRHQVERVCVVRDDAPVAGAAAAGRDPHVGTGRETPALAPAREGVAGARAAHRDRLRGMELAVVVEHGADTRLARNAAHARRRCAVAVQRAGLARRGRARALGIGVAVAAVPDPAAHGGHAIARAGPGKERVAADLELELELTILLTLRADVAGGDESHVGAIDVEERVLV